MENILWDGGINYSYQIGDAALDLSWQNKRGPKILITKDPNKLKVYIDLYDGHCLRAYYYFGDQMVNINLDDPKSINSIATLYAELRQESKAPTFA